MLRELHIANLALIEDVRLEFLEGLNCFTGQTGAGKSLIMGAFSLLLGLRTSGSNTDMLRPGADEARVSGVFELRRPAIAAEVARLLDQELEPGDELLITRKLHASGRSSVSVNGQPATASMIRAVGELMVDIHGQHDHQCLLQPANQLEILDAFGRCTELRKQYAAVWGELQELTRRQAELAAGRSLRRQQRELYEFQLREIEAADPQAGEYHELKARLKVLSSMQRLRKDVGSAHSALYESEGSVVDRLQAITHLLRDLSELDETLHAAAEQVGSAAISLQEAAYDLGRYVDRLEDDPRQLAEAEDRLHVLNRLLGKYELPPDAQHHLPGDGAPTDPADQLIAYREFLEKQLQSLARDEEDQGEQHRRIAALRQSLEALGKQLSEARRAAAKSLCPKVQAELKELGMTEAELQVEFEAIKPAAGEVGGASGFEAVEFMIRTNPGQPARPLRKIASGGEMSRIMLALKAILADDDRISILVFDEIDANIGGRLGTVIGSKLRQISASGHQVLCITHLPQIAAYADRHLRIAKSVSDNAGQKLTTTHVTSLEGTQRIDELAEMLAGKQATQTTRKQAKEMLAAAAAG